MLTGHPFKLIQLRQNARVPWTAFTAVSPEDYGWLTEYRWSLNISGSNRLYAYTSILENGKWRYIGMHRLIVQHNGTIADDEVADHRNGYTLDNRRCNLRPASEGVNRRNRYPFEPIQSDEPYPPPYAPPTGPLLPSGVAYYYNKEYGVWRIAP
jgi:hypothetical protein